MSIDWGDPGAVAVPRSENTKTGDVIQVIIGRTMRDTVASCVGCRLLPRATSRRFQLEESREEEAGPACYAHAGRVSQAAASARRTEDLRARDIFDAVDHREARGLPIIVRDGMIGDPGARPEEALREEDAFVRSRGGIIIRYTHHWERRPDLRESSLASVDSLEEADRAIDSGWFVAAVLREEDRDRKMVYTPAGRPIIVCPHGRCGITCAECRLCSLQHRIWHRPVRVLADCGDWGVLELEGELELDSLLRPRAGGQPRGIGLPPH